MARITRLKKPLQRVVTIDETAMVVQISPQGVAFRPLGRRGVQPVLLYWRDLQREGGMLDQDVFNIRPLLKAAMKVS